MRLIEYPLPLLVKADGKASIAGTSQKTCRIALLVESFRGKSLRRLCRNCFSVVCSIAVRLSFVDASLGFEFNK